MAVYVPRNELSCTRCDGQSVSPNTECLDCARGMIPAPCDGCEQLLHGVVLREGNSIPLCRTCRSRCDRCHELQLDPDDLQRAHGSNEYHCALCVDEREWGSKCDECEARAQMVGGSVQPIGNGGVILRCYCAPCLQRLEEEKKAPVAVLPSTPDTPSVSSQPS